jgi:large subunit ribosomal protein L24
MKQKIKQGDEVVVISGNHRGARAKILQVLPKKERVLVEGINMRKFHEKAKGEGDEGGIREREAPIHMSNVMLAARFDARLASKSSS